MASGEVPNGETQITATFTIPEAAYGLYYVQLVRSRRPDTPYGFPSFPVVPDLKVNPSSAHPGSIVAIKGTGFPAKNNDIKVSLDGADTKLSVTTSELGSFSNEFTIPETIAGSHTLRAYDENLSFGEITTDLQVKPAISIQPQNPEVGSEVTLTGRGFAARSKVSTEYDDRRFPVPRPPAKPVISRRNSRYRRAQKALM